MTPILRHAGASMLPLIIAFFLLPFLELSAADNGPPRGLPLGEPKRVLYLYSYHASFPFFSEQFKSISKLNQSKINGRSIKTDVYMMDTKRFAPEARFPIIYKELKAQIAQRGDYDLILSADDNALIFLSQYKDELFGEETPVVFMAINNHPFGEKMANEQDYTGILEVIPTKATFELAYQVLPKLQNLRILVDASVSGLGDLEAFLRAIPEEYRDRYTVDSLANLSFSEASEILASLGENEAILLLAAYVDREGKRLTFYEVVDWLKANTDRPIFYPFRHGIGNGIAGGKVLSHEAFASKAVEYSQQILSGKSAKDLPLIYDFETDYIFDYEELKKAQADFSRIPKGSVILNEPDTFWRRYWHYVIIFLGVFALTLGFSILVTVLYLKKRSILKELQESEARMTNVFASSDAPMLMIRYNDGRIINANPAALQFYGYSRDKIRSLSRTDLSTSSDEEFFKSFENLKAGSRHVVHAKHRLANGELREVDVILTLIHYKGEPCLFEVIQDVTERKEWERSIIEAKESAEKANKAKDEFLAVMSHELRTPLNPIIGFSSILMEECKDPELRNPIEIIYYSAERMLSLVENILNYARIKGSRIKPDKRVFPLQKFLQGVILEYEKVETSNQIRIETEYVGFHNHYPEIELNTDPHLIRQILDILVNNALKFTQDGIVLIHGHFEPDPERDGIIQSRLHVKDTGVGISKDKQEEIFRAFSQVDNSYTRRFEGAGLGLAIAKELVNILGGTIGVKSEPGKGSDFWFKLPLELHQIREQQPSITPKKKNKRSFNKGYHVLIVEDHQENAAFLKTCLESYGGTVSLAFDGIEGVLKAQNQRYDAILMDLSMPRLNGFEAMEQIQATASPNHKTPICVVTAHTDEDTKTKCMQSGARCVLTKPILPRKIYDSLTEIL